MDKRGLGEETENRRKEGEKGKFQRENRSVFSIKEAEIFHKYTQLF